MDNLSKNIEEATMNIQNPNDKEVNDIQFEEIFNLDKIQAQLTQSLHDETPIDEVDSNQAEPKKQEQTDLADVPKTQEQTENKADFSLQIPDLAQPPAETDFGSKKYVIYVDSDNINYMEKLSIQERKDVVNKILREQNLLTVQERELLRRKKLFKHLAFALVIFIIAFPIMFFIVNTSMMATMKNYQEAKDNFSKLYRQQGKIQQLPPGAE